MAPVIVAKQLGQGKQVCEIAKLEPCTAVHVTVKASVRNSVPTMHRL